MPPGDWPKPWPIEQLITRLTSNNELYDLTKTRQSSRGHDVRENLFEAFAEQVMEERFGVSAVSMRKQVGTLLGLQRRPFPARLQPDIAVSGEGSLHLCEIKSNRIEYRRFDCEFKSEPFQDYLSSMGHTGPAPYEVEQDLIKLRLYKGLSDQVGSCLFLMIDAYRGSERSWTSAFQTRGAFMDTMRTDLVRGWADRLLASTRIVPLKAKGATANLICCEVESC